MLFSEQKRIEDLKKEEKIVKDQVAMAEDELQKTEDLAKKLLDSKTVCRTNRGPGGLILLSF